MIGASASSMRLMTVVTGLFNRRDASGGPSGAALSAAVHRWIEGRLAATGRRVSGDTDEPTPSRPFRSRDGDALGGGTLENAEKPWPQAIRARLAEVRYHVQWFRRPRRLLTARGAVRPLLGDRGKRGTLAEGAVTYVPGETAAGPGATDARVI